MGLWLTSTQKAWKNLSLLIALALWMLFDGLALGWNLQRYAGVHPAQLIANRLEGMGLKAGFANYWVSQPVRYFSRDQILLNSYNGRPISRRAEIAARNSHEIALVWLKGLDNPDELKEVSSQIESLGYRLSFMQSYSEEGWSITVWTKP
jgi:hypothetical protein